jgi:hypothetical protein
LTVATARRSVVRRAPVDVLHTPLVSTTPSEPPAEPAVPSVPYGPGPSDAGSDPATFSEGVTAESVAKGVGRTALRFGIRAIVLLLIRAIFRALFRR